MAILQAYQETAFSNIYILFFIGIGVGVLSALLGVGGGFIFTPMFHMVGGLTAAMAIATSIATIPITSLSGFIQYSAKKIIHYKTAIILIAGAIPASQIFALIVGSIQKGKYGTVNLIAGHTLLDLILIIFFGATVLTSGVLTLRSYYIKKKNSQRIQTEQSRIKESTIATAVCGVFVGLLSSVLGIGGGFLAVPYFLHICKFPAIEAVATSVFCILIISLLTSVNYFAQGQVNVHLAMVTGLGGALGSFLGARWVLHWGKKIAQKYLQLTIGVIHITIALTYMVSAL